MGGQRKHQLHQATDFGNAPGRQRRRTVAFFRRGGLFFPDVSSAVFCMGSAFFPGPGRAALGTSSGFIAGAYGKVPSAGSFARTEANHASAIIPSVMYRCQLGHVRTS
ncbi:hypothetical protein BE20_47915 [Sorangium cellulosum]|nr:hypothetical protein BE20_47915 [Sorangium cellulosum]